jgi:putative DNA-invertase from lambdoid prophage Rac
MAVYGYCRVSTTRQADEGVSLDDQQRRIYGRAREHGWKVDHIFVESGVSGSHEWRRRPEGSALFACLQPGDVVIAAKIDRAFRSSLDALKTIREFSQRGMHLYLLDLGGEVTDEGIGGLIITILAAVAEFERELISERTRAAIAHRRSQGLACGRLPWGSTTGPDKRLMLHPNLAKAIELMRRQYVAAVPVNAIADTVERTTGLKPNPRRILDLITRDQPAAHAPAACTGAAHRPLGSTAPKAPPRRDGAISATAAALDGRLATMGLYGNRR